MSDAQLRGRNHLLAEIYNKVENPPVANGNVKNLPSTHLTVECPEEPQLVLPHDASQDKVLQVGESLLQFEAHRPEGDAVGEDDVPHHVPPHEPGPLVLPGGEHPDAHDADVVWPGEEVVLVPPPGDHDRHVEPCSEVINTLVLNA